MNEAAEDNKVIASEANNTKITKDNDIQSQPTTEDIAREGGWHSLNEWDGPPSDWRSAEVFLKSRALQRWSHYRMFCKLAANIHPIGAICDE